ncbi:MAG: DNA gyrase subunit A [Gemmatimonadetes bacterium]|nr:DNA gyrase subunit A [Gemmatimonadota bacterium]
MTSPTQRERILPRLIEDEMRESFIDYSMSVIVSRALPDVRDGLKPVHRRILYAMNELGLIPGRPYKKSATVVGDVLGKYHPHGDSAVYDSMVRMVQVFSLRYPLVDGQGNFGSVDGDSAAAYRYTEARLTPIAVQLLDDIEKNTVAFAANFDDRLEEPTVLPSKLPNLLINGSSGIAVGMATNIPPHNLSEVVDAVTHLVDNPECEVSDLRKFILGPDFPTGGIIYGSQGITESYETGRGRISVRARVVVEEKQGGREQIVITELPFQVNKARLVELIADLVRAKKITDISDLRDESDRDGMRMVIELKRDANPAVVLNQLYKRTQMQVTFGVIMLALVDGQPRTLNLKEVLQPYIDHRHDVITRRTQFDLDQAEAREHLLEGLTIAVDNIDEVIKIIRKSKDAESADTALRERFDLTEKQSEAILNMRLARLTALEIGKLEAEIKELRAIIKELKGILASKPKRMAILKEELGEMVKKFGDDRRTEIVADQGDFTVEDLIAEEDMVITISRTGYIKRIPVTTYRRQRRGGRGLNGMGTKEDDWVEHLFVASTHDYVLFFTAEGRVYWLKVYDIPQTGRAARGRPIVNLIGLRSDERIAGFQAVRGFSDSEYLVFATRNGIVKKTVLSAYGNPRSTGINAINIEEGDELIDVLVTDGTNDIVLATKNGMSIRFNEKDVRKMGRTAGGVRGVQLEGDDRVIGMVVLRRDATLLVVSEKGMGKRSKVSDYRVQRRGGKGIITLKRTEKTGSIVALREVLPEDELMMITRHGVIIRVPVDGIRVIGRNTQGVRVMNLDAGDTVVDVARVVNEDAETEQVTVVSEGRDQREMDV